MTEQTQAPKESFRKKLLGTILGSAALLTVAGFGPGLVQDTNNFRQVARSDIYQKENGTYAIKYHGKGIEPDTVFTAGDKETLASTIRHVEQRAYEALKHTKGASLADRLNCEKAKLKDIADGDNDFQDYHISVEEARKAGTIASYVKE